MSMSFNNWTVSGNLGGEPTVKEVNGKKMVSFSLAVGRKADTQWVKVTFWGDFHADFIEKYCHKGTYVIVMGEQWFDTWEKDGVKQFQTTLRGINIVLTPSARVDSAPVEDDVTPF